MLGLDRSRRCAPGVPKVLVVQSRICVVTLLFEAAAASFKCLTECKLIFQKETEQASMRIHSLANIYLIGSHKELVNPFVFN